MALLDWFLGCFYQKMTIFGYLHVQSRQRIRLRFFGKGFQIKKKTSSLKLILKNRPFSNFSLHIGNAIKIRFKNVFYVKYNSTIPHSQSMTIESTDQSNYVMQRAVTIIKIYIVGLNRESMETIVDIGDYTEQKIKINLKVYLS